MKHPVVIKLGSGLLSNAKGVNGKQVGNIAGQVAKIMGRGIPVLMVSSGAISGGMSVLKLDKRPKDLPALQACATIGQPLLMNAYSRAFAKHGLCTAQILVTSWDLDSRQLYANTRATVSHLMDLGNCVPIVNENDALSFEEIKMLNTFGDNDRLAAQMALLVEARHLVILSGIDGLYTNPNGTGRLIRRVKQIDEQIESFAGQTQSERSVGGMISKLNTAKLMLQNKIPMHIANGFEEDILIKIMDKNRVGTFFKA